MWFIKHATSGQTLCLLPEKSKYTVGRVGADFELDNDICVSRAHAVFHLKVDGLELEDVGSKYGTFYNKDIDKNTPLEKGRKIDLKDDDLIRFGRLQNVWKVHCMPLNTVTSSLSNEDIEQVKNNVKALGGQILEQYSLSCSHLTMKEPSITMKLLHALVDQKLIVKPDYWKDLLNAATMKKSDLPNPALYGPNFGDNINVGCKPERASLFKNLTFVFLNRKHFNMYNPIIESAGGSSKDLNSGVQKTFLIKSKVVVVQYTPSTQTQSSQTIGTIAEFLQSNSKRIIPEYEIGLAILHCSIDQYCNPCAKMTQTMPLTSEISMNMDEDGTLSMDTDTLDLEIPETNDNLVTSTPFGNISNDESMPNMRITETPIDNPKKRKLNAMSADLNESNNDDLFQFQSKKSCSNNETEQDNVEIPKEKVSTINIFLNKSQTRTIKSKAQMSLNDTNEPSTNKESRKRPHIKVLDDKDEGADDDDLFSFGDTQKTKKARGDNEQPTKDEDSDLFAFKDKPTEKPLRTFAVNDEDSTDMIPTQQFHVQEKSSNAKYIKQQMPKPKILPRKLSAIEWISGSLGKIKIKNENLIIKDEETAVKPENSEIESEIKSETDTVIKPELNGNDSNLSEDHRKWLESLKDVIEIQQISLNNAIKHNDKSHYKLKNHSDLENLNAKNFKTFVKKYHVSAQQQNSSGMQHFR